MSFWTLDTAPRAPALLFKQTDETGIRSVTRMELAQKADAFASALAPLGDAPSLGFILARNDSACVAAYLGALRSRRPLALLPAAIDFAALTDLLAAYAPDWLLVHGKSGMPSYMLITEFDEYGLYMREARSSLHIHPATALLLSTSGSTGSPKMVRLSHANIAANAQSIADYLQLGPDERAITTLPIHYSYGLSILNSHLTAGAATILSDESVAARPFWDAFREGGATSLAGVPTTWQMLQRLRLERMDLPSLRTLTQAGGRLAPELMRHFAALSRTRGWRFFVMYGQTEASPRIAYVPADRIEEKIGAIGIAIPGGALSLGEQNELIYRGPNVMLGYAESRTDLALGDILGGELHTGDIARCDADGYYWLTGRIKRIVKIFGNRVNLDEVEALLDARFGHGFAALDGGETLHVVFANAIDCDAVLAYLRERLSVHPSGIHLTQLAALPLTPSGKIDYPTLREHMMQNTTS